MRGDLGKCAGEAVRIARELHGGRIGQKLPLAAHRGLDELAEENTDPSHDVEHKPACDEHGYDRSTIFFVARAGTGGCREAHQDSTKECQEEDAVQKPHEANIEPHVTIEDVAELMPDDPLEFVARKALDTTARDPHSGIPCAVACGEGIDALLVEHIHLRHRHARGQRHLLHHIQKPAFVGVGGGGIHRSAAKHFGDGLSTLRKLGNFHQATDHDSNQDAPCCECQQLPVVEWLAQKQAESDV